jgi:hypothetical protein
MGFAGKKRADERTRTADLISLRVITQALQGFALACKTRIYRGISFPCLAACALYCAPGGIKWRHCSTDYETISGDDSDPAGRKL